MITVRLQPICRGLSRSASGRTNKNQGIRGRRSAIDLVDQLDIAKGDSSQDTRTGNKLKRSLTKEEEKIFDIASQGSMDATSEEIRDVLNEYIDSHKFTYAFKGFKNASELVEIVDVTCNHDYSHVVALWKASSMELLVKSMEIQHGEQQARALSAKIVKTINQVFHDKEGSMRTNLMRKMDFKRVPKVVYKPEDASLGLTPPPEDINNPLFMRENFLGNFVEEEHEGAEYEEDLLEEEELQDSRSTRRRQSENKEWEEGSDEDSDIDTDEYSDDSGSDYDSEEEEEVPVPRKKR